MASALTAALDKHTPKQIGEKGHVEHAWSHDICERVMQLNFQIVRCEKDRAEELGDKYLELLMQVHKKLKGIVSGKISPDEDEDVSKGPYNIYRLLCLLPAYTRDHKGSGKGEWHLGYVLTERLMRVNPERGKKLFYYFCHDIPSDSNSHPYGSWKDVKYMWNYVNTCAESYPGEEYPFLDYNSYFIDLINSQLRSDIAAHQHNSTVGVDPKQVSLVCRWIPRETSQFGWQFKLLAEAYFSRYLETATYSKKPRAMELAKKKAYMNYSSLFTKISKEVLDTPQVRMCGEDWRGIKMEKLTSVTLRKQSRGLQNITKAGDTRHEGNEDREACAEHFKSFVTRVNEGKVVAKGKNNSIVSYVSDAFELINKMKYSTGDQKSELQTQIDLLNAQWNDYESQINELGPIFAMEDTSGSMGCPGVHNGGNTPLLAAVGLSILVARKSVVGKDRILTFSTNPNWINFDDCSTFTEYVEKAMYMCYSGSTNFYAAMDLILEVAIQNKLSAEVMSNMVIAIFSDMQIDMNNRFNYNYNMTERERQERENTMIENIKSKYHEAGIKAIGEPYTPPHVLFWNLRSTDGFPCVSSEPNTTMASGFNPGMLNTFLKEGVEGMKKYTPWNVFNEELGHERYNIDNFQ